jgi:serine phosphatase RsbU (regulator of sigma subunit)
MRCNKYVSRVGGGRFATAWIGVVDSRTRRIHYVDAGHGHGRHVRGDGHPYKLEGRGSIPLGIDSMTHFESEQLMLGSDERLILYSDGIAEIRGVNGDTFEPLVLDQILRRGRNPQADVSAVIAGLELFAGGSMPSDDASILAFDLPD